MACTAKLGTGTTCRLGRGRIVLGVVAHRSVLRVGGAHLSALGGGRALLSVIGGGGAHLSVLVGGGAHLNVLWGGGTHLSIPGGEVTRRVKVGQTFLSETIFAFSVLKWQTCSSLRSCHSFI